MKRPLPDISDQKLVVLLKRDDLKSYEALFHRYYDLFLTFTKRVVRGGHAAAEAESPESGLEAEQLRQTIARTVAAMPPQRRTIFALSRQENLSRQEIARRLGVSVRTVDKHLELALREIRLRIKDFQWVLLLFLFR